MKNILNGQFPAELILLQSGGQNTVAQRLKNYISSVRSPYEFKTGGAIRDVRLIFSDRADAPSVEDLLVNIAVRRRG